MSPSSSSSSSSRNWVYDVFPSFSGEDIRKNFLSHFIRELDRKLILAFKDNEIEKSRGRGRLVQSIRDSRIAVVVFSTNYASSSWCLNELLEILNCRKEFGQIVIPVFYGLDPSHVRKQTGDFGKVFEETCKNRTEELKNQWKEALTDVANMLGYHTRNCDGEATMIGNIVNDVMGKLNLSPANDFDDFVGIEDHIAKMNLLLDLESEEVRMVGIWGPSGIGKTTIARALFSRLSSHFQGSIFIDRAFISKSMEIYGKANSDDYNMKLHLQKTFLSKLLDKKDLKVAHLGAVSERLKYMNVLIVIDDLDDRVVLDILVGQNEWFGSGSRIIVVTTDKHLIRSHAIGCIYEVDFPSEDLCLEIFCRYAFNQNSPPEGFEKLAVEVAGYAGSLPLGLNVLGSSLRGMDKDHWMAIMPRLHNDLDGKIENVLRFSYDGLSSKDKTLFRHIACLFNLEKVNDIKLLLADSFLDIDIGLENLVAKSLVHVRLDIVEMHSLLQKLGKEVVRGQSDNPGKREFLVDSADICYVLEENSGTRKLVGISLDLDEIEELHIHENAFKNMSNLRFLKIFTNTYMFEKEVKVHLPDSFDYLPPKLKLLRWDGYPLKSMPSNFCPDNLVKLTMKNSKLKKLWEGSRKLTCLKEVNLWGCENLKEIPDLSRAINLKKLYLGFRMSWVQRPSPIRKFNNLTNIGMLECTNLETRPTGINLEYFKRLNLRERSLLCLENVANVCIENLKIEKLWEGMQNSIENKRADSIKEENKHGKTCESTTYGKHMSQHQVFINFWGEEVRFSFISHLVFALSTKGVNVSIDKYEKKGEDLEKTFQRIEDSNIALVVFSSQYTESRWCLDELVKIKKLLDEGKLLIIPIFYKVEPSEVIQLDGDFGLKLWNLWKVHRDHRIIKWKDALETVAARMDRCLKENSSESEFITLIVEKVMTRISLQEGRNQTFLPYIARGKTTRFSAGKGELHESFLNKRHFFGLEQRMKKLEQKLEFDCNETRIIGVVGMAGIGKTTLAMMLHEKWNCKFVRCVPFLDIRKKSEKYSPAWLRKTLLQVLLGGKFGVIKDKMTHESWKEKLLQTKVFVVLDDVSNKKQLEFLLGDLNWIKKGSKIVITSRDKSLIEGLTHDTYLVPPLNNREALQLFSYHTFGDHVFHPTVTSMKPCKELVDCAGGNPLVIKLLSKQFHGRDDARWKMRQGDLTHLGIVILNIFRFSCDELSEKQKDVFLDIACFFRSMDDYFARSLLDSGDHDSESEVKDLTHKGMIAISGCRVEMHDLLYMFGKIFSSQELIGKNGGKSRLWFTQEIFDALINQKDTERIRSIFLDMSEVTKGMVLDRLTFINMPNLRYLKIYDSCCSRQCKALCIFPNGLEFPLENVRYLHWVKYPFEEFPPDFRPENLVDLRLPYSMIERVWEGVKDTPRLKWVDLSHSSKLFNLSALSKAENLMRLNLEGCTNLDELPWEMKNMKSLVYLNMRGCIRLRSLPNMNLIALETLILSDCSNLKEFQVISKSLRVLNLDGTAIKGLPLAIKKLQRLVLLNLKNCKMLESLPNCLGKLKALEELILSGCSRFKNIPDVKHNLKHVQVLLLDGTGVDEMPNISCFTGSKGQASVDMVLKRSGLYASEWPRGFDGVSSLRRLCLGGNDFVSLQDDIGQLYNLTWLDVKQCMKLRSVPILPPRLQYFNAHGCDSLEKVANPLALLKLTEQAHATFNFSNCDKLDQDARNSIISYTRRRSQLMLGALSRSNGVFAFEALTRTCFPGWEVPEWFSNRGSGSLLESQLPPHWCDSRFNGIALCAVILFPGYYEPRNRLLVNCNFEFKNEDGSSTHFSCTVGDWNQLSNTPHKTKSSHVFIGYTSWLDINKHGRYDEEGCFCTKCSLAFQVTDGTEKVLGCEVVECGFNLVYATVERENICWDAKTVVIPKRVKNVPGEDISYGNSRRGDDIQYKSYLGPTLQRDENFLSERKSDALQNLRKSFESKKSDLSKNAGGEVTISSNHLNTPLEDSNTKIHDIWRSCTDQLNERQKNVFLDIACFFRSEDEYFIRSLLDSGDPDSIDDVSEVRDLAQKLLVTICDGRVEMNDPLYTFAKDLGSPEQLRLWKYKDILDKLRKKKDMEASNVRGIFLDMSEVMQIIAMERMTFINMRNLRYLKIYECCCPRKGNSDCKLQFPDGLDFPLKEVRYFHWLKYPLDELPQDFRPENIVDLRLPYSNVEHLWKGVKDTPRLKWVDLSHSSKLVNLSGLAKAESLQRLNVEGCTNLAELPVEMKHMKSLVYLNMKGCIRLRSLPTMDLISLRTLILSDCSNLKDFHVISESLESLHLDGTAIKGLPPTIQKLQRLLLLNLKNCKFLEYLPNSLGKLNSLEELILSGCSRLKNLPDVKHSMKHVQTLLIDGTGVDEMPNISYFIEFEGQSSVDKLFQSIASYCCLSEWPCGVNGISSLQRLCLSGNDFVSLHNDIGKLYNLTWLDVKQCKKLISVPMLPPRLQYLDANGCDSLERVANPLAIQTLTEQSHVTFNFSNCNKLDQDATDAIITYTRWKSELILGALSRYNGGFTLEASVRTCFPGWEVPTWFNHREYGSFLEPKLPPHWCDSKFTGIALCAVILFNGCENQQNRRLLVKCNCEFKNEDGSRIRFSCTVGDQSEPANTFESSHVFIGYASKLDIKKLREDDEEGCVHTEASFKFQVMDGTKELEGYEVMKCGFSLVYASDDLQVTSGEHGTIVEANRDIKSSSWVQDFFGYIFLAFSCVIVLPILSFSVFVIAPQYYLCFSDFCWLLLARILFFVAFGLFLKHGVPRENQSPDSKRNALAKMNLISAIAQIFVFCFTSIRLAMKGVTSVNQRNVFRFGSENPRSRLKRRQPRFGAFISRQRV